MVVSDNTLEVGLSPILQESAFTKMEKFWWRMEEGEKGLWSDRFHLQVMPPKITLVVFEMVEQRIVQVESNKPLVVGVLLRSPHHIDRSKNNPGEGFQDLCSTLN